MNKKSILLKEIITSLVGGILLGALVSLVSSGSFFVGWLQSGIFSALLLLGLQRIWRLTGAGHTLAILMLVAFALRLALGIFLYKGLPAFGFDTPVQQAGYVFSDASERDQAAYQIAVSGEPWLAQFAQNRAVDQYGGLLALSTLIYGIFSSDVHRPLLIVLLSAFAMSAGVAFFHAAVKNKWGGKIALVAAWVYALYPEGVLLGSSQMREPILMGLAALLFWCSLDWRKKPLRTLLIGLLIMAVICLVSVPAGGVTFVVVAGMVFLEWLTKQENLKLRGLGITLFILLLSVAAVGGWSWLKDGLSYEYYLTQAGSGVIQVLLEHVPEKIGAILITLYGLTQPVLPAALVDPSKPIWQGIAIFRAAGWFFILPFIAYGFLAVFRSKKSENRSILIFISLVFAAWVLISSLRAGGDQWDNPRYRSTLLPWMAILVGWVWERVRTSHNLWFWCVVAIETVYFLLFMNFYVNRYVNIGTMISIPVTVLLIGAISLILIVGCFFLDRKKSRL